MRVVIQYQYDDFQQSLEIRFNFNGKAHLVETFAIEVRKDIQSWDQATVTPMIPFLADYQEVILGHFMLSAKGVTGEQLVAFKLKWGVEYHA